MAANLETVVKQLADSGIIAPGKLENFVPPKANPKSVDELVAELVKNKHLTQFQAAQVKAGKAKALILGEYTIVDKIGAGGMGQVFKAVHRRMDRIVAIKMLPPAMTKDAAALARFEREVRAAAKLSHPNIVAAHDAGQSGAAHFLVMEYVDGKDLSVIVKKDGPVPVNKAVNYILQAARGLEFAHRKGVVHRDIKPANLLLDSEGTVKILDMGLARLDSSVGAEAGPQAELTGTGTIMGTVDYMAPEQALNTKHADQRADIYSLGISLYYLLAGKAVYAGDTIMEKLLAHREQPIPSLQDTQTTVSKQLDAVFRKMVAKRLEDRYQTMSEVVEALEDLGFGGSSTGRKGDVASTLDLSSADRKKLAAQAKKKPLGSITEVVASEKTKHLVLKLVGGSFGTIIAPLLVFYLIRHLEKEDKPAAPPAAIAPVATVQPVVVTTNATPQSVVLSTSGSRPVKVDHERAVAQWVLSAGGSVSVRAATQPRIWLKAANEFPSAPFTVRSIRFEDNGRITDADMPQMARLTGLDSFIVSRQPISDKGLASLANQRMLTELDVGYTNVTGTSLAMIGTFDKLTSLSLPDKNVKDDELRHISSLQHLEKLFAGSCPVGDRAMQHLATLSHLKFLSLHNVPVTDVGIEDLAKLTALEDLTLTGSRVTDNGVIRLAALTKLKVLHVGNTQATASGLTVLQKALPQCKITWGKVGAYTTFTLPTDPIATKAANATKPKLAYLDPAFQQWVKATQALPAEKQIEAISKKLIELNPRFDGKVTGYNTTSPPKIEAGAVVEFGFPTDNVNDISPVRALDRLKFLLCTGIATNNGKLTDLLPLKGMRLARLNCVHNIVLTDLSPLSGMPLEELQCAGCPNLSDLSPLAGMPLSYLNCQGNPISDLSPLKRMPLSNLTIINTQVSDLSPLQGMPLNTFWCYRTPVSDLSPLTGMSLTGIALTPSNISKGLDVIRQMKSLTTIGTTSTNKFPPAEFWKRYDAGEFGTPTARAKLAYLDPAFQQWIKATQALPAERQIEAVSQKLMELNPGFDGRLLGDDGRSAPKIENGVVIKLRFSLDNVLDISPVRVLTGLNTLFAQHSDAAQRKFADLSPLEGLQLQGLNCPNNLISDLSPLRGMQLRHLDISSSLVSDLSPLRGMPLQQLRFFNTPASDLSPLEGMPLQTLRCSRHVTDLTVLARIPSLTNLSLTDANVTPASVAALQKALPNCKIEWDDPAKAKTKKLAYLEPAFEQWVKATQALTAEQQIEAVSKKLMELNPGFDGKMIGPGFDGSGTPKIKQGVVTEIGFYTDQVTDISPVRALAGLKALGCKGNRGPNGGKLSDLSPLEGMPLTFLVCYFTKVSDLSPLKQAKLTYLHCGRTQVTDLSPLAGMPLTYLAIANTKLFDLTPLKGMPLESLWCTETRVTDLSPLRGLPLTNFHCMDTPVSDLRPLEDCKSLTHLQCAGTKVTAAQVAALQKLLPNCKIEWDGADKRSGAGGFGASAQPSGQGPVKAWGTPAFQAWVKQTQALPAEQQIEAVSKKLMELNPGFDGKVTGLDRKAPPKVENSTITEFGFDTKNVRDISPVRPLAGLKALNCSSAYRAGILSDLSPLTGMPLTRLQFSDTKVSDLSPLAGMKLSALYFENAPVSDLQPISGAPLTILWCASTLIADLTPLQGAPLGILNCVGTKVSDLSPLRGMPIWSMSCLDTHVSDLSPLQETNLKEIVFTPKNISAGLDVIRQMKSVRTISVQIGRGIPAAEFWPRYDAGEFGKPAVK